MAFILSVREAVSVPIHYTVCISKCRAELYRVSVAIDRTVSISYRSTYEFAVIVSGHFVYIDSIAYSVQ